jgi:hypothetical protein
VIIMSGKEAGDVFEDEMKKSAPRSGARERLSLRLRHLRRLWKGLV